MLSGELLLPYDTDRHEWHRGVISLGSFANLKEVQDGRSGIELCQRVHMPAHQHPAPAEPSALSLSSGYRRSDDLGIHCTLLCGIRAPLEFS